MDKITSSSPYGRKDAKEATKDLEAQRKTNWSAESMLGDIAGSYLSAGLSGGLTGATKGLFKGDLSLKEALATGSKDAWKFGGMEGAKDAIGKEIFGDTFMSKTKDIAADVATDQIIPSFEDQSLAMDQESEVILDDGYSYANGGQVMDQNTLVGLAILSEMANKKKAYDDTPLEEKQPTISEVFASKGKTLGGSNTKSLSQMLGV